MDGLLSKCRPRIFDPDQSDASRFEDDGIRLWYDFPKLTSMRSPGVVLRKLLILHICVVRMDPVGTRNVRIVGQMRPVSPLLP